jgi:histidinol-phosphate aminotransferase
LTKKAYETFLIENSGKNMKPKIPEFIASIKPYEPGKPIEELEREYGITDSIKLASNENPLGASPKAVSAIFSALGQLNRYPEGSGYYLTRKLSDKLGVKPENIVLGNGSDEVIGMLTRAFITPGDEAIMPFPSFLMYEIMVRASGGIAVTTTLTSSLSPDFSLIKDKITDKTRLIFLTHPNNPTGTSISEYDFKRFFKDVPSNIIIVVDEAYVEFIRDSDALSSIEFVKSGGMVVTLRTFSKAYGLAGLRIGYGVMPEEIAEVLHRIRQPFNANSLAQAAAFAALDDDTFLRETIALIHSGIEYLYKEMKRLGLTYFPTQTNFLLIDMAMDADEVFERMLRKGVIVRSMTSYGYPEYIRVNAGLEDENERFIKALEEVLMEMEREK